MTPAWACFVKEARDNSEVAYCNLSVTLFLALDQARSGEKGEKKNRRAK